MTLQMSFIDNRMESYIPLFKTHINEVVNRHLLPLSASEKQEKDDLFQLWMKAKDKLDVNHCYADSGWRALYSRILFKSRIMTILHSFDQILKRESKLIQFLQDVSTIVSIGCGPGPEIAAILMILRINIGVQRSLHVLGVDQYGGWNEYVASMNKATPNGMDHTIDFRKMQVNEGTVGNLPNADLCIMSYTDAAVHSGHFWKQLRDKYRMIVILDQRNPDLKRTLSCQGYNMIEYEFKETKRFFYVLATKLVNAPSAIHPNSFNSSDNYSQSSRLNKVDHGMPVTKIDGSPVVIVHQNTRVITTRPQGSSQGTHINPSTRKCVRGDTYRPTTGQQLGHIIPTRPRQSAQGTVINPSTHDSHDSRKDVILPTSEHRRDTNRSTSTYYDDYRAVAPKRRAPAPPTNQYGQLCTYYEPIQSQPSRSATQGDVVEEEPSGCLLFFCCCFVKS